MAMTPRRQSATTPSAEEIERAVSLADAANALAGYEVSDDVRDLGRRNLRGEATDAVTVAAIATLALRAAEIQ